ncbi:hypothetical protein WBG78_21015 [Chryseolinea sp. T2]
MSNRIKEAVSVIVALALVAAMQYFAAKDCCRPFDPPHARALQDARHP